MYSKFDADANLRLCDILDFEKHEWRMLSSQILNDGRNNSKKGPLAVLSLIKIIFLLRKYMD